MPLSVKEKIKLGRDAGYSDDEIFSYFKERGLEAGYGEVEIEKTLLKKYELNPSTPLVMAYKPFSTQFGDRLGSVWDKLKGYWTGLKGRKIQIGTPLIPSPQGLFESPTAPKIELSWTPPSEPEAKKLELPTTKKALQEAWERGKIIVELGDLGYRARQGRISIEDALKKKKELMKNYKAPVAWDWGNPQSMGLGILGATTEFSPFLWSSIKEGTTYGLTLGTAFGLGALTAGQVPPLTAVPEELLTVPGAAMGGFAVGSTYGVVMNTAKIEGGNAYLDMVEEGIDPDIAGPISDSVGILNGLIEVAQVGHILKGLPGGKHFFKKAVTEATVKNPMVRNALLRFGQKMATGVAMETGEEIAQELVTVGGESLGHAIDATKEEREYSGSKIQDTLDRLKQVLVASLKGFPLLMAPSAISQTALAPQAPVAPTETPPTAIEQVTREMKEPEAPPAPEIPPAPETPIKPKVTEKKTYLPASFFDRYKTDIAMIKGEIQEGTPGRRYPVRDEEGYIKYWTGESSTYPDYFKDWKETKITTKEDKLGRKRKKKVTKTLTKKEVLHIIDLVERDEEVTMRQAGILDFLIKGRRTELAQEKRQVRAERAKLRADEKEAPVDLTPADLNLEVGDQVRIHGEWLDVTKVTDEEIILQDGQTIVVDPYFDTISVEGGEKYGVREGIKPKIIEKPMPTTEKELWYYSSPLFETKEEAKQWMLDRGFKDEYIMISKQKTIKESTGEILEEGYMASPNRNYKDEILSEGKRLKKETETKSKETLVETEKTAITDRYENYIKQAQERGLSLVNAKKWAKDRLAQEGVKGEPGKVLEFTQEELGVPGGVAGFGRGAKGEAELELEGPQKLESRDWQVEMTKEPETRRKINKTQIMRWAEDNFKVPIRGKATTRIRMAGSYYPKQVLIRLQTWGELEPMMHEIGHHIDNILTRDLKQGWKLKKGKRTVRVLPKEMISELASLDYNKKRRRTSEGFAEYIRHYLTTGEAARVAPKFHEFFTTEFLKAHPDIKNKLVVLKSMLDTWQKQGSLNRILEQIDFKGEHTKVGGNIFQKLKDKFLKNWNDEFYLIKKIEDQMGLKPGTGEKINPSEDPFTLATYMKSKASIVARSFIFDKAIDETGKVIGPSLQEIMKPIKHSQVRPFLAYGVAKRALVKAKQGFETGVDKADAKYIVDKYGNVQWDNVIDGMTEWSNHILGWLQRAGALGADDIKLIKEMNPIYLPFKRAFIDEIEVSKGAGGFVNLGAVLKRFKGSGRAILNPLEAMFRQMTELIAKAHKVRLARAIADLAEKEGVGGFIVEVPAPLGVRKAPLRNIAEFKEVLQELEPGLLEDVDIDMDKMMTIFTNEWQYNGKDNIVSIWKNGKRRFYEIHPDLYRAVTGLDTLKMGPVMKLLSPFARLLRLGATGLRIAFGLVRNPWRDAFTYAIFSKRPHATIFDPIAGIYKEAKAKPGDIVWRFKKTGGALSGMMGYDRASTMAVYDEFLLDKLGPLGKILKVAKHPIDTMRGILSFSELAPRSVEVEGMYKKYLKENPDWSDDDAYIQAFNDAQDVTVNFTMSGHEAKKVNAVSAFFNVAIRGPEKVYRAFRTNPVRTLTRGLVWLTIPALHLWWKNKDKEWYKNLPPAYKYNNYFFEMENGDIIRLPIAFDLGIIFVSAPLAAIETLQKKDPQYVKGLMDQIYAQIPFTPENMLPSLIAPIYNVKRNKNFLGIPIESEGMQYMYPTERVRTYTTALAKAISKGYDSLRETFRPVKDIPSLSPIQVDFLLDSYSGGWIRQLPIRPILEKADWPVIGDVFVRMPAKPQRQLNNFYSEYERLAQKNQSDIATEDEKSKFRKLKPVYTLLNRVYMQRLRKYAEQKNQKMVEQTYKEIADFLDRKGYE